MPYKLENNPLFAVKQEDLSNKVDEGGDAVRSTKKNTNEKKSEAKGLHRFKRATFIVNVEILEELKNYAYTERVSLKDLVNELLSDGLRNYKKNGGILLRREEAGKE